jgi:hypothetical protein
MMKEIRLNKIGSQVSVGPVKDQQFYSRLVNIPDHMVEVVWRIENEHAIMRKWMQEIYNLNPVGHNRVDLEMPKELLAYGEKIEEAVPSKKGRTAKRVRDGSDGNAKAARG